MIVSTEVGGFEGAFTILHPVQAGLLSLLVFNFGTI